YLRFEAQLPNECWQGDLTHWSLADDTNVEVLGFIDDHSRLVVAATARESTKAADVVATFHAAGRRYGYPASLLTHNRANFNARPGKGRTVLEAELERLGIIYKPPRPYPPQTCGKIERFPQPLKRFLTRQRRPETIPALQAQLDGFVAYYNEQ